MQYVEPFSLNRHCLPHWHAPRAPKDDLEREPLIRGRSVLLVRIDFHAYLVSNTILSKLNKLPDEVDGGLIVRNDDARCAAFRIDQHPRCGVIPKGYSVLPAACPSVNPLSLSIRSHYIDWLMRGVYP